MKKLFYYLFLLILSISSPLSTISFSNDTSIEEDNDSVVENDSLKNNIDSTQPENETIPIQTRAINPLIAGYMSTIITTPIWKSTAPFRSRNMLDLLPAATLFKTDNDISIHLFYSKDNQLPLGIQNNLDITSQNYSPLLQTLQINDPNSAAEVLELLNNINVEQRHAGILINSFFSIGSCKFSFMLPVGIAERNLFADQQTQERIQAIINQAFPSGSTIDKNREFARLKGGIGDLRINLGIVPLKIKQFNLSLGATAIIPTAVGVILDGRFKNPTENQFSYAGIIDFTNFLNSARTLALEPALGNYGHGSLGLYAETKLNIIPDTLFWKNHMWFDFLFPAQENRLILNKQKVSASFVEQQGTPSQDLADEYELEYLVPQALKATIKPGNIFSYTTGLEYVWHFLKMGGGYNFYFREQEAFYSINNTSVNINDLDLEKARDNSFLQHQLFGELNFGTYHNKMPLSIGIGGGYTFAGNKNSPSNWNVFTKCSWSF